MKKRHIIVTLLCETIAMTLVSCAGRTVKPVKFEPHGTRYYTVTQPSEIAVVGQPSEEGFTTVGTYQTTAFESVAVTTTIKTTTKTTVQTTSKTTASNFDIGYWISYAKRYAASVGLTLDSSSTACWDNPITAGTHCIYLERDINNRLNRYSRDPDITSVWIWYEKRSERDYNIYIGYA